MLKIQRSDDGGATNFVLSGRIEEEHVSELQTLIEAEGEVAGITIDLQEVKLVDRDAVRFLAACEARGIRLKNCPSYVREWIGTAKM